MAMTIVEQSGGQYHVLVIIADGQVLPLVVLIKPSLHKILKGSLSCLYG